MFYYLGAYLYEKNVNLNVSKTFGCIILSVSGYIFSGVIPENCFLAIRIFRLLATDVGVVAGVLMVYSVSTLLDGKIVDSMVWKKLKKNSFGIYLFHQQLIYPCIMLLNGRVHPVVQVILSFAIAITIANIMVDILKNWRITRTIFGL